MINQRKHSVAPGITGCIISVLLVISFFLPRIWQTNPNIDAVNTILIIIILCLSVHLIRITSSLFFPHVWNNAGFLILLFIPVSYLIITATQFIWADPMIVRNVVFNIFLILISLPMFCCYYFTVLWLFCKKERILMITTLIIDAVGVLYCLVRLSDKIFIPLAMVAGNNLISIDRIMDMISPYFSLIIYVLSFANFIICAKLFGSDSVKEVSNNNSND